MRRALAIAVIMASLALAEQLSLTLLWSYQINNTLEGIEGLAFGDNGNLGVAAGCGYIFDPRGNLLNEICDAYMHDVSYCCGRFGFVGYSLTGMYAYITNDTGNLIRRIDVGVFGGNVITMIPSGFMTCGIYCGFFDFSGNMLWVRVVSANTDPAYYNGYWYVAVPSNNKLLIIKDGSIVNEIDLSLIHI